MADPGFVIEFDGFVIDTERYELRHDGLPVHVEPKVFELLRYLVHNRERMVSKEELLEKEVWARSSPRAP